MATYAVLTKHPQASLRLLAEQNYRGKYYVWTDTVMFLETDDAVVQISDKLGVKLGKHRLSRIETASEPMPEKIENPITGVAIIKVSASYWGHAESALWEWLKTSFEGGS